MNGTVVDIPGITVDVVPIDLMDSTDMAYLITIKDKHGNSKTIRIINDKIDGSNKD